MATELRTKQTIPAFLFWQPIINGSLRKIAKVLTTSVIHVTTLAIWRLLDVFMEKYKMGAEQNT